MLEPAHNFNLTMKARDQIRAVGDYGIHELDGKKMAAADARMLRLVHNAHGACANLLDDLVITDLHNRAFGAETVLLPHHAQNQNRRVLGTPAEHRLYDKIIFLLRIFPI
jgi:hypothetical protein